MQLLPTLRRRAAALVGAATVLAAAGVLPISTAAAIAPAPAVPAGAALPAPGTVVSAVPLDKELWVPDTTERAFRLTYVTTNSFGERATSTGTLFLPHGTAPEGGWPVLSWAHGTVGLGDDCAPSLTGPGLPDRDFPFLGNWMKEGYAIVASDYVGLGTPGLMPYLDGKATAHSVVDIVKAGRNFAASQLPPKQQLSGSWAAIGQSQGGGAAIYTARHATELGGPQLDYKGAVGTGTPAYIENLLLPLGPKSPPAALPPGTTAYVSYIFAALRYVHPELGIDAILTPTGRKYLDLAETRCFTDFKGDLEGVSLGDYFTQPVALLPNFLPTVRGYMGMPEDGFDRPFFLGHGVRDTDVPFATTEAYVDVLLANDEPVTFKAYVNDHSGTMTESQRDTIPFVNELFADQA